MLVQFLEVGARFGIDDSDLAPLALVDSAGRLNEQSVNLRNLRERARATGKDHVYTLYFMGGCAFRQGSRFTRRALLLLLLPCACHADFGRGRRGAGAVTRP